MVDRIDSLEYRLASAEAAIERLTTTLATSARHDILLTTPLRITNATGQVLLEVDTNSDRKTADIVDQRPTGEQLGRLQDQINSLEASLDGEQQTADFYRQILHQALEAMFVVDEMLCYRHWNQAMERIFGLTAEQVLGKHLLEALPVLPTRPAFSGANGNDIHDFVQRALAGETIHTDVSRFVHPVNGEIQWCEARYAPLRNASGAVTGVIVTVAETAAQRAETQWTDGEGRFRRVFEEGPQGIAVVDLSLHFDRVNAAFSRLLGYTEDELRSLTIFDVTHPDDIPVEEEQYARLMRGEITNRVREKRYIHKSGAVVWISLTGVLTRDAANEPLYHLTIAKDITARKQAEAALVESRMQLRLALDSAQHGLWDWDVTSGHISIDATWHAILGYQPGELDLRIETWAATVHPDDRDRLMAIRNRHLESDDYLYNVDYRARHKSGNWVWVNSRGRVQSRDADGKPLRMMGTIHDITERKRMEAQSRESDERFRMAIQAMQEGFVMQNRAGEIVICNQSAERILGLTADQMMGSTSLDPRWRAIREDGSDFPGEAHPAMISLKYGIPQHDIVIGVHKPSGELTWVSVNSVPLRQEADVVGVVVTFADITARREAELVLRESEERFHVLVDNLPLIIWLTDASGSTTFLNRFWREFTGKSEAESLNFDWQEAIHPDDLPVMQAGFSPAFAARKSHQAEFRLRHHDGQYRWILDSSQPRFAADGTFLGYIGSGFDITDRKMMLAQMEEASKLDGLGRLAGGIAHDFNNMLTGVIGYTELAKNEVAPGSNIEIYLNNVLSSAQSASALTKQLLMYARRQMVEFGIVNLSGVIIQMQPLLPRMIGEAYELKFVLCENVWSVLTNASQMEQVLLNLIVNARDAMPDGGSILVETANVTLDAEYAAQHIDVIPGEYVMFMVSDHGIGMSSEVKEHIFEPFFTTKPTGEGTGLGLATCYGIVKQSRGHIWVYSEPGQGTTFKVYLPRHREMPLVPENKSKQDLPAGNVTILLVDDEPLVRDIAARILRRQGYQVLEAGNGFEALNVQSQWPGSIALLVTDVVMPLMSGKELAQRLLKLCPNLKVLYMSGYTQNVILHQGMLKPGVALITKPFSSASLLHDVSNVLQATENVIW